MPAPWLRPAAAKPRDDAVNTDVSAAADVLNGPALERAPSPRTQPVVPPVLACAARSRHLAQRRRATTLEPPNEEVERRRGQGHPA